MRQRESLVEFARLEVASARDAGRQALKAQAAEKLERREERVTVMLNKAVERYAYAKELFKAWQGVKDKNGKLVKQSATDMAASTPTTPVQKDETTYWPKTTTSP